MTLDTAVDLSGLIALKHHLESFLKDYEEKVASARSQLHHVEALLEHYPDTSNGSAVTTSLNNVTIEQVKTNTAQASSPQSEIVSVNGTTAPAPTTTKKTRRKSETIAPELVKNKRRQKQRQVSPDMLPIFAGQTLTQAVLNVMTKYRGKCIDADGMVQEIYGEVSEEDFLIVKDRITKNLSKGKIDGLWERVPEQLGYYTISVKDLDRSLLTNLPRKTRGVRRVPPTSSPNRPTAKGKAPKGRGSALSDLKMRSPYQGSSLMDAIAKVMQEHKGEFVDADTVMRNVYGELPLETRRIAKDRITKGLSKGKIEGMWERVPERIGYYTLSMSAVMS